MADRAVEVAGLAKAAGAGATAVEFNGNAVVHDAGVGDDGAAGPAVDVDVDVLAGDFFWEVVLQALVAEESAVVSVLGRVEARGIDAGDGAGGGGDEVVAPAGLCERSKSACRFSTC